VTSRGRGKGKQNLERKKSITNRRGWERRGTETGGSGVIPEKRGNREGVGHK